MAVTVGVEAHGDGIPSVLDGLKIEVAALYVLILAVYLEVEAYLVLTEKCYGLTLLVIVSAELCKTWSGAF